MATEEGFVKAVTTTCKHVFPWFKPTVQRFLLLPHDWQLLTGTFGICGLGFVVVLLVHGLVGELTPPILMAFIFLSTVIGLIDVLMWKKLEQEGLAP